jgi:hypothetical protein
MCVEMDMSMDMYMSMCMYRARTLAQLRRPQGAGSRLGGSSQLAAQGGLDCREGPEKDAAHSRCIHAERIADEWVSART